MKKVKFTSVIAGLLVCVGALSFIAAGGRDDSEAGASGGASAANVNAPGVFPIVKEPITLNIGIRQSSAVENYETNLYTKKLEEAGNITFNFELYPAANPGMEKLLVQIAGGGVLPEVLMDFGFSDEVMYNLGAEGTVLALNDYYEKWAHYIPQQLEKVTIPNVWQRLHSPDGNLYYIPWIIEQIGETYSLRGWMNQPWLDKLGLKMPETTDEFRKVLEAFRDRDPNENGLRDEIPSGGTIDQRGKLHAFLMNAFIYEDNRDHLWVDGNGKVDVIYNKPEYREGLRYIRGLMADGLIHDQLFTINGSGFRGVVESQEKATVGFFTQGFAGALSPNNQLRLDYVPMKPLKGPRGVQWTPYMPNGPGKKFVITKDAKNPEAAFRLGDYMCSEEMSIWVRFGAPEQDWRAARPGEVSMYQSIGMAPRLAEILPFGSVQNSHWSQGAAAILYMGIMDGQVASDNPMNNEIWVAKAVPLHIGLEPPTQNRVDFVMYLPEEIEQLADIKTAMNSFVNENFALFVMGEKDINRDWDAYVRELDRIGLKRYLEITQSGYERAIGKK